MAVEDGGDRVEGVGAEAVEGGEPEGVQDAACDVGGDQRAVQLGQPLDGAPHPGGGGTGAAEEQLTGARPPLRRECAESVAEPGRGIGEPGRHDACRP